MSLLDRVFRLTQRDEGQPSPRYVPRLVSASQAAATVEASWTNDNNVPIEIENIVGTSSGGGAQTTAVLRVQVVYPSGLALFVFGDRNLAVASHMIDWQGRIVIAPGVQIVVHGEFSAGVAANSVGLHTFGQMVPVGNLNL